MLKKEYVQSNRKKLSFSGVESGLSALVKCMLLRPLLRHIKESIQWNPDFSNLRFLKPPDFSNQFSLALEVQENGIPL